MALLSSVLSTMVLWLSLFAFAANAQESGRISEIVVAGNRAVHSDAVLGLMNSKAGDPLDANVIRNDIKALYRSGYFQDVRIETIPATEGAVNVIVRLKEKPSIYDIKFVGFAEVTDDSLKEKLQTKRYTIVDERKIAQDLRMIEQTYIEKGFYLARANYSLENLDSGEVNLVFSVIENSPVSVGKVHVIGNVYLSDSELKTGMFTREKRWGSWLSPPSGTFKDEFVGRDKEYIEYAFKDTGFAEAEAGAPQARLDAGRQNVEVSFFVAEGERYNIGTIKVTGDLLYSESYIKEKLALKEGQLFRISQFQSDMRTLQDMYGDEGYAFADLLPRTVTRREERKLDIEWVITKGQKVYFRNIVIEGNSKTRDNVIRRNMKIAEGDRFHATNLDKSRAAIERLGFFEEVQLLREPDAKNNAMDIRVRVKEKMTGSLNASLYASPGTGESSKVQFGAKVNYNEANLLGRGWAAGVGATITTPGDPQRQGYELDTYITEPSINDGPWSVSLYGKYKLNKDSRFVGEPIELQTSRELGFGFGREIIEDLRFSLGYSHSNVVNENLSPFTRYFVENGNTEKFKQSITYDSTDNYLMPTSGFSVNVDNFLGFKLINGEHYYGLTTASASLYVPVEFSESFRTNFRFAFEPGYVYPLRGRAVPPWERFILGSPLSMRAYLENRIGPITEVAGSPAGSRVFPIHRGGNRRLYTTAEYYLPLIPEANLRFVTFGESGTVLDDNENFTIDKLKYDVGFGFRWQTPLAPFRFDWAWPVDKDGKFGDFAFVFNIGFDNQSSF